MSGGITFIRKNGRVIPIGAAAVGAARTASVAHRGHQVTKAASTLANHPVKSAMKVNNKLDAAGLGLSVASGVIGAATFAGGAKSFVGGALVSHAIDALGISANIASVAGDKGSAKDKAAQAGKQEARNFAIGNAIYAAGILGFAKNRQAASSGFKKGVAAAQSVIAIGRKFLKVAV